MRHVRTTYKRQQRQKRNRLSRLETLERRQLLAAEIPNFTGDGQIGVVGTAQVSHLWTTINLDESFTNPVVIAGPPSSNNSDPTTVRVRNVNSNSFQISVDEWDYLDGVHPSETVSYLVVEGGTHTLTNGSTLVAGYLNNQTEAWTSFSTDGLFDSRPVVLSQIMTDNDDAAATTRTIVSSNNDFEIRIQEEQAADGNHGAETVGIVLIEQGVGSTGDQTFQSFITSPIITHNEFTRNFAADLDASPALFANMQTINGTDPATVRVTDVNGDNATFFIEEEKSGDTEIGHSSAETVGGLVIETGGIFASSTSTISASDRFEDLENHLNGTDTMFFGELRSWSDDFDNEKNSLGSRPDDFLAAVEVVKLYESRVGPLFRSAVSEFDNDWPNSSDGRGLERAIFRVHQAIFDAIDSQLIAEHPELVDTVKFRATEIFPGSVPSPIDATAVYQVQIDGTLEEQFGSPGGYDTNAARRMTGAYLSPGSIAEVIVPQELVNAGFTIRVGGHSWDLESKNVANRLHRVSNQFAITSTVTQVANPMGGNIYIEVPVGADAGIVDVQFRNTIRAPFFSDRSFDKTTESEWNTERNLPGAFTDIESEYSMWTVPSKWVRTMSYAEIMEIIDAHDAAIQTASVAAGKPADRTKAILYMIVDTQIRGTAFSIGYPQSNYGNFSSNTVRDPLTVENASNRVLLHEHGHAELLTMFAHESEAQVHMLATAVGHKVEGFNLQQSFARSMAYGNTFNHTTSDILNSWVVMDQFLSGQDMVRAQAAYRPRGHADYVEYVELFGWEAYENFHRTLSEDADGKEWSQLGITRTAHNANDRILRLSREAGVNVAPLFELWGHSPSNFGQLNNSLNAEGLGASVGIYDRLVDARDSVPQTQAQWNAVDNKVRAYYFSGEQLWDSLRNTNNGNTGYVASSFNGTQRRTAAVDRIDALIAKYFPSGRPEVVDRNTTDSVVLFEGENFHGQTLELTEGRYANVDLDASLVRNNETSSISIPEGYEVTVYNFQFANNQETYTSSMAELGDFDNQTSSLVVTRATIDGLSVEIGGTAAGSQYDQLITNAGTLDGLLDVTLTDSFIPSETQTYTIVDSSTNLAGEFDNIESGQRMETTGGQGSFVVNVVDDTVVLSDFVRNAPLDAVVFYQNEDFHGYSLELTEGDHPNSVLVASQIGNNAISSISIPDGFEVTVFNFWFEDDEASYSSSMASLGDFDDRTSSIRITRTTIDGLSVNVGGTTADAQYDQLITNSGTLDGTLTVSLTNSFIPTALQTFTVVDSTTNLAGSFDNVQSGQQIETTGGEGFFDVTYVGDTVVLSNFELNVEVNLDFGDAPQSYPTLLANDGARHVAVGPQLGLTRDVENDGVASAEADGDGDDEDGVLFGAIGVLSTLAAVNLELTGVSEANPARVDAWIDFDRNGIWEDDEKILNSVFVDNSMQTLNYDLPTGLTAGNHFARVRLSTAGGLSPIGLAPDGEVEDYLVRISDPPKVESITVNGGDAQRSSVNSVEITFDQVVDIDTTGGNPFALFHSDGTEVVTIPTIEASGGKTVVNLAFDSSGSAVTSFGSLENGDYQLVIDASRVSRAGTQLDGDEDGTPGENYVMSASDGLFRKYGDYDGNGSVGLTDFAAFRQTFGKSEDVAGYLDSLDFDGDDIIGLTDFAAFRSGFGN